MAGKPYIPAPITLDDVTLPEPLIQLTETIARNTHEVWSAKRLEEGWHYGKRRDDVRKLHPNLVPYEQLSEGDREYDRATALNAIKLLVKLGYSIVPPCEADGASS